MIHAFKVSVIAKAFSCLKSISSTFKESAAKKGIIALISSIAFESNQDKDHES